MPKLSIDARRASGVYPIDKFAMSPTNRTADADDIRHFTAVVHCIYGAQRDVQQSCNGSSINEPAEFVGRFFFSKHCPF